MGNSFELLNCDDHVNILRKNNRDVGSCRPDITHQCLLMLLDSPLNRAGLLQVYVHTSNNVLIEINPQTRIPRTFKRFAGLMGIAVIIYRIKIYYFFFIVLVQLLHRFAVRASNGNMKLLKVIKNPITDHLPVGIKKICTSFNASNLIKCSELVPETKDPVAIIVGAIAHGKLELDYTESTVSISNYPLSAALTCTKICSAFEDAWSIF